MAFVCIVDDDASVRKSLGNLLRSAGHETASFDCGEALLQSPSVPDATCILLDLKMKGMSGLEVQRSLRTRGQLVPIVFMSAHGDEESMRRAFEDGAVEFLKKPFSVELLLGLIETIASEGRSPTPDGTSLS
ncbi:response regulator transcription factor [Burkholderia ubonensis]|uniref:response regulator transcription factor n=1 Tax=Burkholderia ubonensis TaxID=101571 RepID=UPI000751D20B|nr:response regulator [Burkholderia ubonensis]KWB40060.1 two-component system response regulator [Burkholderia ubonensis]